MTVWVERATTKVFPDSAPKQNTSIDIKGARGEYESSQIVIRAVDNDIRYIEIYAAGDLEGESGEIIPGDNIKLFRVWYVHISSPSPFGLEGDPRDRGEYPDPLIPFYDPYGDGKIPLGAPFDVKSGMNQPVFVEVYIPYETSPGIYKNSLIIMAENQPETTIPLTLTVWDFTIPKERSITTAYGFGWSKILWYHGGEDNQWDEGALKILKNYEEVIHEHRLDTYDITQSIDPPFSFDEGGNLRPVDWDEYNKTVGPRVEGYYFGDGIGMRRFNCGFNFFCPGITYGLQTSISDDEYVLAAREYARYLKEMGWFDKVYVYAHDEPHLYPGSYERITHDVELMLEGDPAWKGHIMDTTHIVDELLGYIDIWCPDTVNFSDWFWPSYANRDDYRRRLIAGNELWFYVCLADVPPYAGYDIDTIFGHEPRMVKWGAWFEGASGFLYWSVNYWYREDPWGIPIDRDRFGVGARNGDGFLLYPGDHNGTAAPAGSPSGISIDGPIPTYRLKMIRDGLEDWEYFILASQLGEEEFVREEVAKAYGQFGMFWTEYDPEDPPWSYDDELLYMIRERIAERIIERSTSPKTDNGLLCNSYINKGSAPLMTIILLLLIGVSIKYILPYFLR